MSNYRVNSRRFNPFPITNQELAIRNTEQVLNLYKDNDFIFTDWLTWSWSVCYTTEMRLEDVAYEVSNLWC